MKYLIFYALLSLSLGLAGASFPSQTPPEFQTLGQEPNMPAKVEDINRLLKYAPVEFYNELKVPMKGQFYTSTASRSIARSPMEISPGATIKLGSRSGASPLANLFDIIINDGWISGTSLKNNDIDTILHKSGIIESEKGRLGATQTRNPAPSMADLQKEYSRALIKLTLRKKPDGSYEVIASLQR